VEVISKVVEQQLLQLDGEEEEWGGGDEAGTEVMEVLAGLVRLQKSHIVILNGQVRSELIIENFLLMNSQNPAL